MLFSLYFVKAVQRNECGKTRHITECNTEITSDVNNCYVEDELRQMNKYIVC
jgi:hypothetical protein